MYRRVHAERAMESTAVIYVPGVFLTKNGNKGLQAVLKDCLSMGDTTRTSLAYPSWCTNQAERLRVVMSHWFNFKMEWDGRSKPGPNGPFRPNSSNKIRFIYTNLCVTGGIKIKKWIILRQENAFSGLSNMNFEYYNGHNKIWSHRF